MNVMRSHGQENLTYVLLTDAEVKALRGILKGLDRTPFAKELRRRLKRARG